MKPIKEVANEISNVLKNENVQLEFFAADSGKKIVMGLKRQVGNRVEIFKPIKISDNPEEYSLTEFEIVEKVI